jgi:hypothetical protein
MSGSGCRRGRRHGEIHRHATQSEELFVKVVTAALATAAVVGVVLAPGARADNEKVTIPSIAGKKVTTKFTGKFPLGTNMTTFVTDEGHCKGNVDPFNSVHTFNVVVPAGAYKKVKAKMYVSITSSPVLAGDFMEVLDPQGNSVGTDQQKPTIEVEVFNPAPGKWTVLTCQFIPDSAGDHSYSGEITVTTKKK